MNWEKYPTGPEHLERNSSFNKTVAREAAALKYGANKSKTLAGMAYDG